MVYRDESLVRRCALCQIPLEQEEAERFATLDLCRPCLDGTFGERVAHRGIRVQQLGLVTRSLRENRTQYIYTLVSGTASCDLSLQASFSREDLFSRVGKLFRPELKVGDPLFDDTVFIRTDDKEGLARLLRVESLQSVIHHAISELAEHEQPLRVDGPRVRLRSVQSPSSSRSDYLRRIVALVLHHLVLDAEARGVPRAEPPPLFDFSKACKEFAFSGSMLTQLYVRFDRLEDLQWLVRLKREEGHDRLRQVGLNDLRLGSSDLTPLAAIPGLEALSLARVNDVVDLSGLADAFALQRLDVYGCPVFDLAPLAGLSGLQELNLNHTRVRDLSPLAGLGNLKRLFVQHSDVQDLSPLAKLTALEWLNVRDTEICDLEPLLRLTGLQRLDVKRSRVPAEQLERLSAAIPGLQIDPHP